MEKIAATAKVIVVVVALLLVAAYLIRLAVADIVVVETHAAQEDVVPPGILIIIIVLVTQCLNLHKFVHLVHSRVVHTAIAPQHAMTYIAIQVALHTKTVIIPARLAHSVRRLLHPHLPHLRAAEAEEDV
jgi:hypothetical protein